MAKGFTTSDLLLLGYERAEELGVPNQETFRLFRATATAGVKPIEHHFLYLKDDGVTERAISNAAKAARGLSDLHVVYPDKSPPPEKSRLELQRLGPAFAHRDLIWRRLESLFSEYVESLKDGVPQEEWFIQPRYAAPQSENDPRFEATAKPDDDILAFLCGQSPAQLRAPAGNLLVVTAPAGVGKTTLARRLVRRQAEALKRSHTIPVYVEASHWGKLQLPSVSELWEIIRNSLTTFSSGLSLKEELFEYALREGWISFIFDGFDELCAGRTSHFSANEVLKELASMAQESEARIVVTTRSLFWDAEVTQRPENVSVVGLAPFNKPQAAKYFEVRFSTNPDLRSKASNLYSALTSHTHTPETPGGSRAQLINTPICVAMIAEYVEQGRERALTPSNRALTDLLIALCERDRKRQKFVTPPDVQIRAFGDLAVDDADEFDNNDLQILGFDDEDIRAGRTVDHVLLSQGAELPYRMRYEFLPPYFRALHIADALLQSELRIPDSARRLIIRESNGRGYVLEHLVQILPRGSLDLLEKHAKALPTSEKEVRLFFFHLLKLYLEEERPKDTAAERSFFLLTTCFGAVTDEDTSR